MLPHMCATCIVPPVLIVWHGLILNKPIYISPTLHAPGPKQNRVSNDPLTNLQEVTTRKKDVYFIVWRLGHTVIVNQAMCCICHNLFWYFCLKVSVCPQRRLLTVRALFKSRSPDECREEHFKCQQPCSSLARRNAVYCQLNLCKSSWMCSTGGGGSLRTAYMTALEARSSHSSCARRRHFSCSNSNRGAKLFVPPVWGVYFTNQLSARAVMTFAPGC